MSAIFLTLEVYGDKNMSVRKQTRQTATPGKIVPDTDWIVTSDTNPDGLPAIPGPSPTGLDIDGVRMIEPSNPNGPAYFYKMSDSITNSKYINTDRNAATQEVEGMIQFKRLTSNDVTYSSGTGKTCRININAGGFIATQAHTWQTNPAYIWTPADSKNVEFTYYFRVINLIQSHTSCSSKMRGGIHTGSNDPRASCFETTFFIVGGESNKMESAYEYNHPSYVFETVTEYSPNLSAVNKWIGRKTICYTSSVGLVHAIDYVDWHPFDSLGKPLNNWTKLMYQSFPGTSTNGYSKVPTWGGMFTFRQDGYEFVDIAIISIREILPPT